LVLLDLIIIIIIILVIIIINMTAAFWPNLFGVKVFANTSHK
jgi:hypothetical protein